jgi:hypothetical protein
MSEIEIKADVRGEIIDVKEDGKTICIVHSLPQSHRGGFYFPDSKKIVSAIEGSIIFYLTNPKNPKKQKEYKISTGNSITIPKGIAYREFNEEEVYFTSACILSDSDKKVVYEPYRRIIDDSLK